MSVVAHFFVVVSGSKIHERAAHFFVDIYTLDRIFDDATVFKLRGESFRGKKLETVSRHAGKVKAAQPMHDSVKA